jgi:hypothetical protein
MVLYICSCFFGHGSGDSFRGICAIVDQSPTGMGRVSWGAGRTLCDSTASSPPVCSSSLLLSEVTSTIDEWVFVAAVYDSTAGERRYPSQDYSCKLSVMLFLLPVALVLRLYLHCLPVQVIRCWYSG